MIQGEARSKQQQFESFGVIGIARRGDQERIESYISAQVLNLGPQEAYIETDVPLDLGRKVSVWLYSSGPEGKKVEHFGVLQWKKRLQDPFSARYGYGIQLQADPDGPNNLASSR